MFSSLASPSAPEPAEDSQRGGSVRMSGFVVSLSRSGLSCDRLDNRLDVTDFEGKAEAGLVTFDLRCVVGHQHTVVSDFPVHAGALEKVDIAFVGKRFAEIQ